MRARQVDGVITATARLDHGVLDEMAADGLPIVLVNRRLEDGPLSSSTADDREGARLAVEHLAQLGHTRIAHLGGPQGVSTGRAALRGLRRRDETGRAANRTSSASATPSRSPRARAAPAS